MFKLLIRILILNFICISVFAEASNSYFPKPEWSNLGPDWTIKVLNTNQVLISHNKQNTFIWVSEIESGFELTEIRKYLKYKYKNEIAQTWKESIPNLASPETQFSSQDLVIDSVPATHNFASFQIDDKNGLLSERIWAVKKKIWHISLVKSSHDFIHEESHLAEINKLQKMILRQSRTHQTGILWKLFVEDAFAQEAVSSTAGAKSGGKTTGGGLMQISSQCQPEKSGYKESALLKGAPSRYVPLAQFPAACKKEILRLGPNLQTWAKNSVQYINEAATKTGNAVQARSNQYKCESVRASYGTSRTEQIKAQQAVDQCMQAAAGSIMFGDAAQEMIGNIKQGAGNLKENASNFINDIKSGKTLADVKKWSTSTTQKSMALVADPVGALMNLTAAQVPNFDCISVELKVKAACTYVTSFAAIVAAGGAGVAACTAVTKNVGVCTRKAWELGVSLIKKDLQSKLAPYKIAKSAVQVAKKGAVKASEKVVGTAATKSGKDILEKTAKSTDKPKPAAGKSLADIPCPETKTITQRPTLWNLFSTNVIAADLSPCEKKKAIRESIATLDSEETWEYQQAARKKAEAARGQAISEGLSNPATIERAKDSYRESAEASLQRGTYGDAADNFARAGDKEGVIRAYEKNIADPHSVLKSDKALADMDAQIANLAGVKDRTPSVAGKTLVDLEIKTLKDARAELNIKLNGKPDVGTAPAPTVGIKPFTNSPVPSPTRPPPTAVVNQSVKEASEAIAVVKQKTLSGSATAEEIYQAQTSARNAAQNLEASKDHFRAAENYIAAGDPKKAADNLIAHRAGPTRAVENFDVNINDLQREISSAAKPSAFETQRLETLKAAREYARDQKAELERAAAARSGTLAKTATTHRNEANDAYKAFEQKRAQNMNYEYKPSDYAEVQNAFKRSGETMAANKDFANAANSFAAAGDSEKVAKAMRASVPEKRMAVERLEYQIRDAESNLAARNIPQNKTVLETLRKAKTILESQGN